MKKSNAEKAFQVLAVLLSLLIFAAIAFPLLNIISISISSKESILTNSVSIYPIGFNFDAYKEVLSNNTFFRSLLNTVGVTVISTILAILVITMVAYALNKDFYGKKVVTYYFIITMYFSGGLIPTYLLVSKYLGLRNSYFAFILPALVNVFYIIVVRSQIEALPPSLLEASIIDGANEFQVVFRIVLPAITPTIAAVSMFIALGKWNMWFPVMIYTNKESMWTLQYFLRVVVFDKFFIVSEPDTSELAAILPQNFQMAAIVLVALPIVSIYPFVQKYFVSGILSGSVKG